MSLNTALKSALDETPDAVFVGYLDLEVGTMIATEGAEGYKGSVVDSLTAAAVNLYESSHSIGIENAFRQATGREHELEPYFKELAVVTAGLVHAFVRAADTDNRVFCLVAKASAGPGNVLEAARGIAKTIEGVAA